MSDIAALEVGDTNLSVTVVSLRLALAVVAVKGEVDIATAATLRHPLTTLVENGYPHLVLDLSQVTFLDSSGLAVLVEVLPLVRRRAGTLRLAGVRSGVLRILEIAGLAQVFPIHGTPEEAVAGLADREVTGQERS